VRLEDVLFEIEARCWFPSLPPTISGRTPAWPLFLLRLPIVSAASLCGKLDWLHSGNANMTAGFAALRLITERTIFADRAAELDGKRNS
jgi:hypothetical protein